MNFFLGLEVPTLFRYCKFETLSNWNTNHDYRFSWKSIFSLFSEFISWQKSVLVLLMCCAVGGVGWILSNLPFHWGYRTSQSFNVCRGEYEEELIVSSSRFSQSRAQSLISSYHGFEYSSTFLTHPLPNSRQGHTVCSRLWCSVSSLLLPVKYFLVVL